jgi:RNA polymerase sigma factor (sigma-70 family)
MNTETFGDGITVGLPSIQGLRRRRRIPKTAQGASDWPASAAARLLLTNLTAIRRMAAGISRQHGGTADDAEEFTAVACYRLVKDDYAALRKFKGRSSLRTFLFKVLQRMFLDYRIAQWGKWRPSATARREGALAVQLDRLTRRDGLTFDEACSVLEASAQRSLDTSELDRLRVLLPARSRPRFVTDEDLIAASIMTTASRDNLMQLFHGAVAERAGSALRRALAAIPPDDWLVLKLRFQDQMTVRAIAKLLEVDGAKLYRRIDRLLAGLRASLEEQGVAPSELFAALAEPECHVSDAFIPRGDGPAAPVS